MNNNNIFHLPFPVVLFLATILLILISCSESSVQNALEPDHPGNLNYIYPDENPMLVQSMDYSGGVRTVDDKPAYVPGQVNVILYDDAEAELGDSFFGDWPVSIWRSIPCDWGVLHVIEILDGSSVEEMASRLSMDSHVRVAEPNYYGYFTEAPYVPNDPLWESDTDQGDDPRDTMYEQWGPSKLAADIVWNDTKGDPNVIVAVIDTGVRFSHEDLTNQYWINEDEIDGNNIDDDDNGYIDDWRGWNTFEHNNFPFDNDGSNYYHGTGCAGVIAGEQDNSKGISGIAPGVKIMVIRADMNDGPTCVATVVEAWDYAKTNGADIISMSFIVLYPTVALEIAATDTWDNGNGPIMMASAGNYNNQVPYPPAMYPEVICVGATVPFSRTGTPVDEDRIHAGWAGYGWGSTYGSFLNIMGFGERTYSTFGSGDSQYWGIGHPWFNGTSCACPTSAGVMALMVSSHPGHDGNWYWDRIEDTADDLNVLGFDIQTAWGRVNALRAVYGSDRWSDYEDDNGFIKMTGPFVDNEAIYWVDALPIGEEIYDSIHDVETDNPFFDDHDYYVINNTEDSPLRIYLDIYTWGENLDIAVYSDENLTSLIDSSTTVNHADSSYEEIILPAFVGIVFLDVYSPAPGGSTTYGLIVENQ